MRSRLFYVAIALVMGTIGLVAALALNGVQEMATDLEQAKADNAKTSTELANQKKASIALAEQVERLGGKPVVDPPATTPPPLALGPTDAQVQAAVADYCTGDRCVPTVSRSQVAAAVAAYCAGGTCRGKDGIGTDGQDGADGANGANGSDGAPGPGPTADQIAAAVEAYCAGGNCRGDDGANGTDGTDGKDGRSVESVQCDSGLGTFTFTYSDGTSQTVQCSPVGEQ